MVGGNLFPRSIPAATRERVGNHWGRDRLMGAVTEEHELPSAPEGNAEVPAPSFVSQVYAAYVLAVLFVVTVFNYIDRQILAILLQPIKNDLKISDTALGFLTGFAFVAFYTCA